MALYLDTYHNGKHTNEYLKLYPIQELTRYFAIYARCFTTYKEESQPLTS
ncbi:MAG: hypothetical protein K2J07_01090 [Muribaculaceae bacterium]|nr:hypothetical protein [Muribaculaceae bacterium]MDE6831315.1 hypothetical protein [Muribaculaceae bacterium]